MKSTLNRNTKLKGLQTISSKSETIKYLTSMLSDQKSTDTSKVNKDRKITIIKQLGQTTLTAHDIKFLVKFYHQETNSIVKREIISTIGRQRNRENVDVLISLSHDPDPKLVLQTLRALNCFKTDTKVKNRLKILKKHKNELIREFIQPKSSNSGVVDSDYKKTFENRIYHNDALSVLEKIDGEIVDLTFTSPPYYNARDYSIYQSYEEYLDFLERVFSEVYRITSEGRFFVLNTSPIIVPRTSRKHSSKRYAIPFDIHARLEKIGFEFIDDIIWKKPAPSAKNRNGGFFQHRKPLGYKPNLIVEYVMVYRKKTDKLIDWNMKQYDDDIIESSKIKEDYEMTNVWNIGPTANKVHPATFPKKLASDVVKFYSYVGDLVLDPFAGVGTVGMSCIENDRKYLLIEKESKYVKEIKRVLVRNGKIV